MVKRFFRAVVLTSAFMLPVFPAAAACFFISLQEFHVDKAADPFSKGDFSPFIALEAGRNFPLAPARMAEAPHATRMEGRRYYIPRHLIDDAGRFSLRVMMLDHDKDTPDDLVLPLSERSIVLSDGEFEAGFRLVTVRFMPFADDLPTRSNAQRFTFEIQRESGPCASDSEAGRSEDRHLRHENELRRLWARIQSYGRFSAGGPEYLPYRLNEVNKARMLSALASAFDVANVNARELIALGRELRELSDVTDFNRVWFEYTRLVRRLLAQKIPLRYRDENGAVKKSSAPSLAFHPVWKNLREVKELPVLPEEWGIALPER